MDAMSGWKDKSGDYKECLDEHETVSKQSGKCETNVKCDETGWRVDIGLEESH